jgi:hypothetical protein
MRRKLMWSLVVGGVMVGAATFVGNALATDAVGFTSTSQTGIPVTRMARRFPPDAPFLERF